MTLTDYLFLTGLLASIAVSFPAIAQTPETDISEPESAPLSETGSAVDLVIPSRLGVEHSTSGGGFDGVTQFEGFIPLRQDPGQNITFFVPQLLLDNDGNIGGSLLLGHRFYSQSRDRIFGSYVAFDSRETHNNTFHQLGLGLESLGETWDFRINGYLPLGSSRQLADERRFDTGFDISSGFEENLLVLSSRREQQINRLYEAALFGLDAEAGVKLAEWDEGNDDLRAFGGVYFYDAISTDSTLGWRLRLEARPTQNFTLGLALQNDDIFGTNIVLSTGLTWPRVRPRGPITEVEDVPARLGETIVRLPNIPIDAQQESETIVDEFTEPLMNPEEEQPYRFVHVTLGQQAQGDGTFENPFGTVEEALEDTLSDGNNIVYINGGNNPDIPAFTIPDRVRVLSQGPVQLLAGLPFPGFPEAPARLPFSPVVNYEDGILVHLPFSGDGNFPRIQDAGATDLVAMSDRTVLSGFRIANARGNAVISNQAENIEIRDNAITNAGERGIFLNEVTGSVVLFNNSITGSRGGAGSGQGILIRNSTDGDVEATIQSHQIVDNRVAIETSALGNLTQGFDPQQIVNITDTNLRNSGEQALLATASNSGNQQISFRDGNILNSGAEGLLIQATNIGSQELILENSTVRGNGGDGIRTQSGTPNGFSTAAQEVFIRRNQIINNGGDGISIESNEVAAQELAIDANVIQGNGGAGIRGVANNLSFQEYVTDAANSSLGISNNVISGNGDQGIVLTTNDSATLITDIQENSLSDNTTGGNPEVEVTASSSTTDVCVVLNDNTSATGIRLDNNSLGAPGLFEVGDLPTVSSRNIGEVFVEPNSSVFTNKAGAPSCFRN
ncbi:right-handed parallel beta-helix repeat-containing protein [Leptolyngbya sp. FACHB-541]|uniref:right-handed parallel beta-helix repeat-containing protein n=1 Tax=Leptolyngbya sp. FACHB-541 TaxID=2692810 RepID=UPI00168356A7|nr:right-handed parallel beta-helix repeat-containing protein [Leptolyngbya sp. FACHB-541]MBD1996570.1 right-handed parallel beta-helix repeat-containing protein [Leptolyngbya sp. FACHB-541]